MVLSVLIFRLLRVVPVVAPQLNQAEEQGWRDRTASQAAGRRVCKPHWEGSASTLQDCGPLEQGEEAQSGQEPGSPAGSLVGDGLPRRRIGLGGSSRSKSRPELIYKALEQRMEEDWTQASVAPGATATSVAARGWLEQRAKSALLGVLQAFGTVSGKAVWKRQELLWALHP